MGDGIGHNSRFTSHHRMKSTAILLDLDGTLVDTNAFHVEAHHRAHNEFGYLVSKEEVARLVGMGGEKLVPALIGEEGEALHGEAIRDLASRVFTEELTAGNH